MAFEKAGVTDSIEQIANIGTVSFEFYDDSNLSQPISLKVGCYTNGGMNAAFVSIPRLKNNAWKIATVDMAAASFIRGDGGANPEGDGWTSTLSTAPDFCPTGRNKKFQIFVSVGDRTYNADPDETYYFDRFQMGDASNIYDFDIADDEDLAETPLPPAAAMPVPLLPPLGVGLLVALLIWRARRSFG
ncbi:MAG: hypothetical protein ISP98_10145 [Luminiphilus sp.]|nr:hypothetical protein [Luminiphilus sp.]